MADKARLNPDLMSCFGEDFGRSQDISASGPMQLGERMRAGLRSSSSCAMCRSSSRSSILFYIVDHLLRFVGGALDARGKSPGAGGTIDGSLRLADSSR